MRSSDSPFLDLVDRERVATEAVLAASGRTDIDEKPFGLYFLPARGTAGFVGKVPEVEVFWEHFKNDRNLLEKEYGAYDPASVLITVIDHEERLPAGTIRVIGEPSPAGLKTLQDFAETPEWQATLDRIGTFHGFDITAEQVLDIATLAVRKPYRRSHNAYAVSLALYHGLYLSALLEKKDFMVGALDDAVVELQTSMGIPWEVVCDLPSVEFLGSPGTSPVIINLDGVADTFGRSGEIGRMICFGEGLEGDLSMPTVPISDEPVFPPDLEFAAADEPSPATDQA